MSALNLSNVFKLSLPVATAYVPLGAALGVFMVSNGFAWFWAPVSALLIYAGSVEFLVASFIVAGYPLVVIAWTALIVNFRHIFYGLSFPMALLRTPLQKFYGIFALTDEAYGIVCAGSAKLTGAEVTALQLLIHTWWVSGALMGAVAGSFLPPEVTGFEFALTAMFLVLAVDAVRADPSYRLLFYALLSGGVGLVAERWVLTSSFLGVGIMCYLLLISADYSRTKPEERTPK